MVRLFIIYWLLSAQGVVWQSHPIIPWTVCVIDEVFVAIYSCKNGTLSMSCLLASKCAIFF